MKIASVLLALIFSLNLNAQKEFEGIVVYNCTIKDSLHLLKSEAAKLEFIVYFQNGYSRTEERFQGVGKIRLYNDKTDETCMLIDLLGQRLAICDKSSAVDQSSIKENLVLKFEKGKKEIAGYKCRKATLKNDSITISAYYTDDLPVWKGEYDLLPGMPLEIEYTIGDITMHYVAASINNESLASHLFEIPDSYEKLSMTEFHERFGSISID